ncbi:hypothetical protein, partial [Klebsiella aerogenes]|uniref:hypothetical protein n=1 Tax=Klebsiella aerogenes TaxID=548 RepID=UPI001CC3A763
WLTNSKSAEQELPLIHVLPFMPEKSVRENYLECKPNIKWQFLYVATGEAHKNHCNLIKAWEYLHEEGINPILALTISKATFQKRQEINW